MMLLTYIIWIYLTVYGHSLPLNDRAKRDTPPKQEKTKPQVTHKDVKLPLPFQSSSKLFGEPPGDTLNDHVKESREMLDNMALGNNNEDDAESYYTDDYGPDECCGKNTVQPKPDQKSGTVKKEDPEMKITNTADKCQCVPSAPHLTVAKIAAPLTTKVTKLFGEPPADTLHDHVMKSREMLDKMTANNQTAMSMCTNDTCVTRSNSLDANPKNENKTESADAAPKNDSAPASPEKESADASPKVESAEASPEKESADASPETEEKEESAEATPEKESKEENADGAEDADSEEGEEDEPDDEESPDEEEGDSPQEDTEEGDGAYACHTCDAPTTTEHHTTTTTTTTTEGHEPEHRNTKFHRHAHDHFHHEDPQKIVCMHDHHHHHHHHHQHHHFHYTPYCCKCEGKVTGRAHKAHDVSKANEDGPNEIGSEVTDDADAISGDGEMMLVGPDRPEWAPEPPNAHNCAEARDDLPAEKVDVEDKSAAKSADKSGEDAKANVTQMVFSSVARICDFLHNKTNNYKVVHDDDCAKRCTIGRKPNVNGKSAIKHHHKKSIKGRRCDCCSPCCDDTTHHHHHHDDEDCDCDHDCSCNDCGCGCHGASHDYDSHHDHDRCGCGCGCGHDDHGCGCCDEGNGCGCGGDGCHGDSCHDDCCHDDCCHDQNDCCRPCSDCNYRNIVKKKKKAKHHSN